MGQTAFNTGDALAVQVWSSSLAIEAEKKMYFKKFMGTGDDALIKIHQDLQKSAGEKITVGLAMKMTGDGVEGDNPITGTSAVEGITFFNDALYIDQRRKATKDLGKMSQQRVPYNIRKLGRDQLATWWAEDYDAQCMIYLAGARGVDTSLHVPTSFTGRAQNTLQTPDSTHLFYAGDATSKSDLDSADTISLDIIDRCVAKVETTDPAMLPFMVDGELKFVFLMHIWNAFDLRRSTSENDWIDIHKYTDGKDSLIYKNALGEYNGIILHKHRNVVRFSDYGSGGTTTASRCLLLGAQAGIISWGGGGGPGRYTWNEEELDAGNQLQITAGAIYGVKKSRYNSKDFGVVAVDAYCDDPNS